MNKSRHKPNKSHANCIMQIVPCKTSFTQAIGNSVSDNYARNVYINVFL